MKWREVAFYLVMEYNYDGRPVNCYASSNFQSANQQLTAAGSSRRRLFVVKPSETDEFNIDVTLVSQFPDW